MNAPSAAAEAVRVATKAAAYDVHAEPNALRRLADVRFDRAVLIVDEGLPTALVERASAALDRGNTRHHVLPVRATERTKSVDTWAHLLHECARLGLDRSSSCVVALGGGIVGDVAGFVAASYQRGIPVVQCPTTLLSMVDASVGGKTGVNLAVGTPTGGTDAETTLRKNYVGAFHQPDIVLADIDALATLPDRVFRAGLGECVKHGMIAGGLDDARLLADLAASAHGILERDPATLARLVRRNVALKARVVAADERERDSAGGRALLNLGHTFAHAIEPIPHLSPTGAPATAPLQHGEAVALGLAAASAASVASGRLTEAERGEVLTLLERFGLPTAVAGLPDDHELIQAMASDKKAVAGQLRVVFPISGCRAALETEPDFAAVAAGWSAIRK